MSIRNLQLIKWAFPTFALIIGLYWYKRRRVDRVDPGGQLKQTDNTKNSFNTAREINSRHNGSEATNNTKTNFYDSGIHIDESFAALNHVSRSTVPETGVCSPRKVSDNMEIPIKKSSSQPISIKSGKTSLDDSNDWYIDIDDDGNDNNSNIKDIILGSNPKTSDFELITRSKAPSVLLENINDEKNIEQEQQINDNQQMKSHSMLCEACDVKSSTSDNNLPVDGTKTQVQAISERDSANHSPVSGVLEGSVNDEIRSEGSTDSGKGGSINGKQSKKIQATYQFELHRNLVGQFIGKRGSGIQTINAKASVKIVIGRHPTSMQSKLCSIEGSVEGINIALDLIRQRFPEKKYPELTLEQVNIDNNPDEIQWITGSMQLNLIAGVNNDVLVCHILQPDRIFVQIPTHPTYPGLRLLDYNMTHFYDTIESPAVPDPLTKGMLVVAKSYDKWVRAYVEEPDPNGLENIIRLVDHGGFWKFSNAEMRKIRLDYMSLPFQAIDVSIANIRPVGGEWHPDAYKVLEQICFGVVGQAQIEGYIDSTVYVSLYVDVPKHGLISVAQELIARGFAEPMSLDDIIPQNQVLQEV